MKMDGSGQDRVSRLDQPLKEILAIGVILEAIIKLSLTIVKLPKEMTSHAFQF